MRRVHIVLIVIMFVILHAGCKDNAAQKKTSGRDRDDIQASGSLDKALILQIDRTRFTNKDLKRYIRINYPDLLKMKDNLRLLSRIFDMFIDYKVSFSIDELAGIKVEPDEYENYITRLAIPKEKIDRAFIINSIKLEKYLEKNVYKGIDVGKEEIKEYYDQHNDEFTKKEEVMLFQIFVKEREKAIKIKSILDKEPHKFEDLAASHSESIEAKNGGLMGYFEKGILPTEMEDVVFSLKINEISPVTESPYGFHIFKVTKQKQGGRLLFYENVEGEIKNKLLSQKLRAAYQDFFDKLKSGRQLDIRYENLFFEYQPIKGEK